jgi:phage tail-like protein
MKSKEYQFLTINTKNGWHKGQSNNLEISEEGIQIKRDSLFVAESTLSSNDLLNKLEAVDLAVTNPAQLYLLDENNRRIWFFNARQKQLEPVEILSTVLSQPTQIAVSEQIIFVADKRQESEETTQNVIYAFSKLNLQIRWVVNLQEDIALENARIADMATDTQGNLYVLLNYNLLDTGEKIIAKYTPSGQRIQTEGFTRGDIEYPTAIALTPNGSVYILDSKNKGRVVKFSSDSTPYQTVIDFAQVAAPWRNIQPSGLAVDSQGNLYIGDASSLPQREEDTRFIIRISPPATTDAQPRIELIPGYRGAVTKLTIDRSNRLYVFNSQTRTVQVFKKQHQFLRVTAQNLSFSKDLPTGTFSTVFDSTTPGQRWHKFVLEGEIPSNTQILASYFVTDDERYVISDSEWSEPVTNPKDALIRGNEETRFPSGRYLHLKVQLIGTEDKTPKIRSIRAYFPRLSYLRYLPAVYQEEETSRDFLERFLSIFETFFIEIEEKIDYITRYFDAEVVDGDFLRWLSHWLAITVDNNWTEQQLREIVKQAPLLYKLRGTKEGIAATVELLTGDRPLIIENFPPLDTSIKNTPEREEEYRLKTLLYGNNPFRFWVLLNHLQVKNEVEIQTIQRLIDTDKPAYTEARLKVLQPGIALNKETYLEFNSYILQPSLRLDMGGVIAEGTVLTDDNIEEVSEIERRSRLGIDTRLI